jgi:hypothetical protein
MIKVITNILGNGDSIHIKDGDHTIFEGHRPWVQDLVFLLGRFANANLIELTHEEMEEGVGL